MAKNLKFYFDEKGQPCARGPQSEHVLLGFLENDVRGDDHICHDLMEDITAIEESAEESREFNGKTCKVTIEASGITIETLKTEPAEVYQTGLKHFSEILEDWEAFILDDQAL